jgi:hypothetical protein
MELERRSSYNDIFPTLKARASVSRAVRNSFQGQAFLFLKTRLPLVSSRRTIFDGALYTAALTSVISHT